MVVDKKPTHAVWLHSNCVRDVWENTDGVFSVLPVEEPVSLEVKANDVGLCAQAREVPRGFIPLAHGQARQVSVHKSIYC